MSPGFAAAPGTKDYLVGWDAGFFISNEGINNPLGFCSNERFIGNMIEIEDRVI